MYENAEGIQPIKSEEAKFTSEVIHPQHIVLTKDVFGVIRNDENGNIDPVYRYTWTNRNLMKVSVMTYGATILSICVPGKDKTVEDVLLGFESLEEYQKYDEHYFGSTIGRVTNIVSNAQYDLGDCNIVDLSINHNGRHHFNGGFQGFTKVNWLDHVQGNKLILSHFSINESEGYPGSILTQITFSVTNSNSFKVSFKAITDEKTPINLSQRLYFNLAGHSKGHEELYKHVVCLNASKYVKKTPDERIPMEETIEVGGTVYDFRVANELRISLSKIPNYMLDEHFLLCPTKGKKLNFVGRIIHPDSGRALEIYTNQRCVHFSLCDNFPDPNGSIAPVEPTPTITSDRSITKTVIEVPLLSGTSHEGSESIILGGSSNMDSYDQLPSPKKILGEIFDKIIWLRSQVSESKFAINEAVRLLNYICKNLQAFENDDDYRNDNLNEIVQRVNDFEVPILGKDNSNYTKNGAFFIQTQNLPNGVNMKKKCPDIFVYPHQIYSHDVVYKFGLHIGTVVENNKSKKNVETQPSENSQDENKNEDENESLS